MAALFLVKVCGNYVPRSYLSGAKLHISVKSICVGQPRHHLRPRNQNSTTTKITQRQPTTETMFLPPHALQHPTACRSFISNQLPRLSLELPLPSLDRLAAEVVSTAAGMVAGAEQDDMGLVGFDIVAEFQKVAKDEDEDGGGGEVLLQLIQFGGEGVYVPLTQPAPAAEKGSCSICLEEFSSSKASGFEFTRSLDCKHVFHGNCINQWLQKHNSCPLCRRPLSTLS